MCDVRALNLILARESPQLKKKMADVVRHRERRLELESRLRGRAWGKAEEEGTVHLNFSFENEKVLAESRVFEEINRTFLRKRENLMERKNNRLCEWIGDKDLHVSELEAGNAYFVEHFQMYNNPEALASRLPLDVEVCGEMAKQAIRGMHRMVELDAMVRHAYIASKALGADVPATVNEILNRDERYFRVLKDQLFSDLYAEVIESLRAERSKEEIVDELLKLLYPDDWERYRNETRDDYPEMQRAAKEAENWERALSEALRFVRFSPKKAKEFMRLSGKDIGKAVEFAKLADEGMFAHDIFLLMKNGASPGEVDAHVAADKFLGLYGLTHENIMHAVRLVGRKHRDEFLLKLEEYAKWVRLMPEGFTELQRQELSSVLALALKAPERPKEVYALLSDDANTLGIIKEIFTTGEEQGGIFQLFGNYKNYARLVSTGTECVEAPHFTPPHGQMYFSELLEWSTGEREVSSEDVKYALIYGLKLYSEKGMREGRKQIPVSAFQDRLRKILPPREKDSRERAHKLEDVLAHAGVLSYTKDDSMVGLNINGKGIREGPTKMGKEILLMTKHWIEDTYPAPARKGGRTHGAADYEEEQKAMPLRADSEKLVEEFLRADGTEGKVNFLRALEKVSEEDAEPALNLGMSDPDEGVRAAALDCMAALRGKRATLDAINMLLLDGSLFVQENAAKRLGELGAHRGIGPLMLRLNEGAESVRAECARSLGKMMSPDAISALENAAEHDQSEKVRLEASEALMKIRPAE